VIPVNEPHLGEAELQHVAECVQTGWISSAGRFITDFEEGWSRYCGRQHGVAVANGTAALQLALVALGLEPGDEVIMPSFTIISCALAAIYSGGIPVLVDADPETWCMNVGGVESRIGPRTRAIMPVHIYGHPVDMDPLIELADENGLAIVEDAAEAHGAEYRSGKGWRRCGGFGDLSCFSFYANKLITTGEGGMVVTDDDELAEKARSLRNLCFLPDRRFYHEQLGFNFRLTNLQAALGVAQLERMDEIVERKREIARAYTERLSEIPGLQLPTEREWARSVFWMFGLVLSDEVDVERDELSRRLRELGVETRPFFVGLHEQPALRQRGLFEGERYPVTDRLARRGLYLPSGLALTDEQLERVCAAIHEAMQ
jgi:perosamine synthetase